MAEKIARLKQKQIEHAAPPKGRKAILLADGGNLYLQATRSSDGQISRSWIFRYQDGFKPDGRRRRHDLGLGPLHTFGLAAARQRALELRHQIKLGTDPLESRRQAKRERLARQAEAAKVVTFRQAAEMYLNRHSDRWRNEKHRAQWHSTLATYAYPVIGDLAVADVDESHLLKVLEPIWKRVPETASRLRARIENVLGYATASKFRHGDNPARWRGHLKTLLGGAQKDVEHHAALPFLEAPAFMAELRSRDSTSARVLEFLILTAARTNEAIGATWNEIDTVGKTWTIPGARMKAKAEHKVPLTKRAVEILQAMPKPHRGPIFRGGNGKSLSNMAMLEMLRGMRPGLTVHGFRSTFRDWASERTNFPNHVAEKALAHKVADKVEAAYRRGELFPKRAQMMKQWAAFLAKSTKTADVPDFAEERAKRGLVR
jgi:integrase